MQNRLLKQITTTFPTLRQPKDKEKFGDSASAQCYVINLIFDWLRNTKKLSDNTIFVMCPTVYCSAMAEPSLGKCEYLITIGENLREGVQVLWTGDDIIAKTIDVRHAEEVASVLQRKPLIWDNVRLPFWLSFFVLLHIFAMIRFS